MVVTVKVVPNQGSSTLQQVDVNASGASLGEVLTSAGLSPDRKDLAVNDVPASKLDTHVPAGATVLVTERPRGS